MNEGLGSPPHTRGSLPSWQHSENTKRITPAYAGITDSVDFRDHGLQDHPRIRGDHAGRYSNDDVKVGSPPHTRGSLRLPGPDVRQTGITPAYAGITGRVTKGISRIRDHPRIRGDHISSTSVLTPNKGSPPHTRGSPRRLHFLARQQRITPAYAGITCKIRLSHESGQDHPRIRGDHNFAQHLDQLGTGSPPHTRGSLQHPLPARLPIRITPAYAGITSSCARAVLVLWDHPRIRGDHNAGNMEHRTRSGSPPHTRGSPS